MDFSLSYPTHLKLGGLRDCGADRHGGRVQERHQLTIGSEQ